MQVYASFSKPRLFIVNYLSDLGIFQRGNISMWDEHRAHQENPKRRKKEKFHLSDKSLYTSCSSLTNCSTVSWISYLRFIEKLRFPSVFYQNAIKNSLNFYQNTFQFWLFEYRLTFQLTLCNLLFLGVCWFQSYSIVFCFFCKITPQRYFWTPYANIISTWIFG